MSEIDRRNMLVGISGASAGIGYLIPTTVKAEEKLTGWQPIETAPKDGTTIMLYSPDDVDLSQKGIYVGYWLDMETHTPPGTKCYKYGKLINEEKETKTYSSKHWFAGGHSRNMSNFKPTHWMPLLDPPQTA